MIGGLGLQARGLGLQHQCVIHGCAGQQRCNRCKGCKQRCGEGNLLEEPAAFMVQLFLDSLVQFFRFYLGFFRHFLPPVLERTTVRYKVQ